MNSADMICSQLCLVDYAHAGKMLNLLVPIRELLLQGIQLCLHPLQLPVSAVLHHVQLLLQHLRTAPHPKLTASQQKLKSTILECTPFVLGLSFDGRALHTHKVAQQITHT
jgi:hypothetical protein